MFLVYAESTLKIVYACWACAYIVYMQYACWERNFCFYAESVLVLHCYVQNFYRTPAGYTADRKTRRKRDMSCYGLLSAASHPPPPLPPPPSPTLRVCRTACGHVIRIRGLKESPPPPHRIVDRFWQPRPKSRMASILETVSMIAKFGQQQWLCTNFRCSDRTHLEAEIEFLSFHRK